MLATLIHRAPRFVASPSRSFAVKCCTKQRFDQLFPAGTAAFRPPGAVESVWYESDNCGAVIFTRPENDEHDYVVLAKKTQAPVLKYAEGHARAIQAEVGNCERDLAGAKMICKDRLAHYEVAGIPKVNCQPFEEKEVLSKAINEPPVTRYFGPIVEHTHKQMFRQ